MGLKFDWANQNIVNPNVFFYIFVNRGYRIYSTKWNAAISASSDGLIYKSYKVSDYFIKIVIQKHKYAFVKFVAKNH